MKHLAIDIETYSSAKLSECGIYRYAEAPDFRILLFGCSVDGGPAVVFDLADGEGLPAEILAALVDPGLRNMPLTRRLSGFAFRGICGITGTLGRESFFTRRDGGARWSGADTAGCR